MIDAGLCHATRTSGCRYTSRIVPVGRFPNDAVLDPANRTVYIPNRLGNSLTMINAATCSASESVGCGRALTAALGMSAGAAAVDASTHTIYVSNFAEKTVAEIDANSCNASTISGCTSSIPLIKTRNFPGPLALNRATETLYVNIEFENGVSAINAATCDAIPSRF